MRHSTHKGAMTALVAARAVREDVCGPARQTVAVEIPALDRLGERLESALRRQK